VPFVGVAIIMLPAERLATIKQVALVAAGIDVGSRSTSSSTRSTCRRPGPGPPLWHVERYAWLDKLGIGTTGRRRRRC
jgi:hypothetical protein